MAILLNGGSDPRRVRYNGTYLSKITYNGTTVWEDYYEEINSITGGASNNSLVTATGLERIRMTTPGSYGYPHKDATYKGKMSGTILWDGYRNGYLQEVTLTSGGTRWQARLTSSSNYLSQSGAPHDSRVKDISTTDDNFMLSGATVRMQVGYKGDPSYTSFTDYFYADFRFYMHFPILNDGYVMAVLDGVPSDYFNHNYYLYPITSGSFSNLDAYVQIE